MIKVGALYFFTEYLRDKAKEKLDNNKSTTQIWISSFFYCLALSFVLSASYFSNDGCYCISQVRYGCSEKDYDPNFKTAT